MAVGVGSGTGVGSSVGSGTGVGIGAAAVGVMAAVGSTAGAAVGSGDSGGKGAGSAPRPPKVKAADIVSIKIRVTPPAASKMLSFFRLATQSFSRSVRFRGCWRRRLRASISSFIAFSPSGSRMRVKEIF